MIIVIMAVALVLRILFLLQARDHLFFNKYADSLYYQQWAMSIHRGQSWTPVFFMSPLYPYLMVVIYFFFGPHVGFVQWFQVLLGTASCGLIYLLGRMIFGRTEGLLAALICALYAVEIFYNSALLMASTLFFLNTLLLVCIHWALRQRRWMAWIVPGLLLGLSALGRANILVFAPFLIAGVFLTARRQGKAKSPPWRAALAIVIGMMIILTPVAVRNIVLGDDWVLITSNLGLNFYVGNNPEATGYYEKPRGLDLIEDSSGAKIASILMNKELKPSEVSQFWLGMALSFMKTQPGEFVRLSLKKVLFFWNAYEIPQMENINFFKRSIPVLRWPLLGFFALGPLGLLGIALCLSRWRDVYFLLTFVLSLMGIITLFFVLSRFRLQVCSALMIFAAYSLVWLWERLKKREVGKFFVAVLVLIPLSLLVNWRHPDLNQKLGLARAHNTLAMDLIMRKDFAAALGEYDKAEAIYPQLGDTDLNRGVLSVMRGDTTKALDFFAKALAVDPHTPWVHMNLGNYHYRRGRLDEAIAEYEAEIRVSPFGVKTHRLLSKALRQREQQKSGAPGEQPRSDSSPAPEKTRFP